MSGALQCRDKKLWELWQSLSQFNSLLAADELGLFAPLRSKGMTVKAFAQVLDIENRAANAIVEYIAALELLDVVDSQDGIKEYSLNAVSKEYLLPDSKSLAATKP